MSGSSGLLLIGLPSLPFKAAILPPGSSCPYPHLGGGGVELSDVDCLLEEQLLGVSSLVNHCGLLSLDGVVAFSYMFTSFLFWYVIAVRFSTYT